MSHYRLLIPTINPSRSAGTVRLASPFLKTDDSCGTLLGIIEVPAERVPGASQDAAHAYRTLLTQIGRHTRNGAGLQSQVRIAHVAAQGIREAALETDANLLLLDAMTAASGKMDAHWTNAVEDLLFDPPCDVVLVRPDPVTRTVKRVLLAVRGGPNAELALRVAGTICGGTGAELSLLHVFSPGTPPEAQATEEAAFERLEKLAQQHGISFRRLTVTSASVREAILREASHHQVTIMGATMSVMHRPMVLGMPLPRLLRQFPGTLMVAKRRGLAETSAGKAVSEIHFESRAAVAQRVDRWFMENTFHNREFSALGRLVDLKRRQRIAISVGIPTHNNEATIRNLVRTVKDALMERVPLLDEIVVIDSASSDRTARIAEAEGASVVQHAQILARYGSFLGRGEALWKSLHVLTGQLVCWLDATTTPHPKLVYGLLGPLLTDPEIHYVKSFHRQPLAFGEEQLEGGDRVTELAARPLVNLFFPELSGLIQPLSPEFAGRRNVLESVPFYTGNGMELGLLLSISETYGVKAIAQVDLGARRDGDGDTFELSMRAFANIQVALKRLGDRHRIHLLEEINKTMKLIHYDDERFWIEQKDVDDQERPAMETVPEYFLARHRAPRET